MAGGADTAAVAAMVAQLRAAGDAANIAPCCAPQVKSLLANAATMIENLHAPARQRRVNVGMHQIVVAVADDMKINVPDMLSPARDAWLVRARDIAAWAAREVTSMSLAQIGRRLGGRDHSSILAGMRRAERMLADPYWCGRMQRVLQGILRGASA